MLRRRWRGGASFALSLFVIGATSASDAPPAWSDNFVGRVEMLALLQTLNADLLSHDSATLTLERWCGEHHMANPARVTAQRETGDDKPLPADLRAQLAIAANETVRYRRVLLRCGDHVLSEADNWYVPGRLTATMNRQLETTDISFGRVVMPLHFRRKTLDAHLLWSPLPAGWEMQASAPASGRGSLPIPHQLLQHRAVLYAADNRPFSALIETYTDQVLAFPPPDNH
jgi:chorismate-pyruvate lyase